jgi:SAM-dependent methyltransferase
VWKKIVKSWRTHGPITTVRLIFYNVYIELLDLIGIRFEEPITEYPFDDDRYGIDTNGIVRLEELDIASRSKKHGLSYQGVGSDLFTKVLEDVIRSCGTIGNYTFIDIGSGKGRALFLAARYPFKEIVGVEFSKELNAVAKLNIEKIARTAPACGNITSINMDALDFEFPNRPMIIFLYNPFRAKIMSRLVKKLEHFGSCTAFDMRIIYINPLHADIWERSDFFEADIEGKAYAVFRRRPAASTVTTARPGRTARLRNPRAVPDAR